MSEAQANTASVATAEQALGGLIGSFATDNYVLSVTSFDDDILRLAIDAGPGACAECLVPESMMVGLVRNSLPANLPVASIRIRYPILPQTDAQTGVETGAAADKSARPARSEAVGSVREFRAMSLFPNLDAITDGVPTLPVSESRLRHAVAASGRAGHDRVGQFPGHDEFTVSQLAEVMLLAGCRVDAAPLLIAAFEIMTDARFPIGLFTHSKGSFFPFLIVNGPVRHQLQINCRPNVFGPGFRANATIGRAVRLGLSRFAGARMDGEGPSALGTAFRFTCVIGEDEENSSWPPLHTEFGLNADDSSVMVLAARQPGHVTHQLSVAPAELATAFADELIPSHCFQGFDVVIPERGHAPKAILIVGEDHRGYFRDAGWDRAMFQDHLHAVTQRDEAWVRQGGYTLSGPQAQRRPNGMVSPFAGPGDYLVVSAGSGGGRSQIGSAVYGDIRKIATVAGSASPVPAPVADAPGSIDDYDALVERYMDGGATDGWPIIPPDAQGVAELVAATGRPATDVIGTAPWRPNPVTVGDVAINAYMAGCGPELMPLLAPMFEKLFSVEGQAGLGGVAASTGGYNCWFIIHGPIARELGINGGSGLFGPGAYANVALGRAIRLAMMNLAGLKPNLADRSCLGQAYKYGVVFTTDQDTSWGPIDLGADLAPGESGFTLLWGFHTRLIMNEEATTPEQLLRSIADGMTTVQNFDSPSGRPPGEDQLAEGGQAWVDAINARSLYVVMSKGHRDLIERAGWDREMVRAELAAKSVRTVGELRRSGFATSPFFMPQQGDDDLVHLVTGPDKIVPIAAGGPGGATLCFSAPLRLSHRLG